MKKILSLCVAALAAITMTAQDIAVNIKLVAQSGGESTLLLASGTGVSAADNATLVAPMANTDNVAIYVQGTDERYSIYATDGEFANLPVSFVTDRMAATVQSYTLHFEDVLGGAGTGSLRLKDVVTGTEITIADGDSYGPFVVNTTNCPSYVAGENKVVNRFVINYVSYPAQVTTNDYGWASFSFDQDLVPVNATAQALYKGAINGDVLALDPVDYVKAGEGVIVYGAPSTTYYFAVGNGAADFSGNDLKATATYNTSMKNVFVLKGDAFLEYVGTNALAANKAYIQLPAAGPNNAPKRIRLVINGTQDVENVETETIKAEKFVEDGQVLIRRGNEVYNLQGQIVK